MGIRVDARSGGAISRPRLGAVLTAMVSSMSENVQTARSAKVVAQGALLKEFLARAESAGMAAEVKSFPSDRVDRLPSYVVLEVPNGRKTRRVFVFPADLEKFVSFGFEHVIVLGDFVAFIDTRTGLIEAGITGGGPGPRGLARVLQQIPGVQIGAGDDGSDENDAFLDEAEAGVAPPVDNWRIVVENEGVSLELSPASDFFEDLLGRVAATIKLTGIATSTHDTALEALERYASALLFDIDLVYGVPAQLARQRRAVRARKRLLPEQPPKFPRNHYAAQALELYQYGRSAAGLPLLEYLAYYQSLEYFFPYFAREQTVHAVRSQLLRPGFDPQNDDSLSRLIALAAPAARSGMAEREQLRATVRACVTEPELRDFIESLPEYVEHFCSKSQAIKGVGSIQLTHAQTDLRDQVADRVYAIRCRIVHAKQDGGGSGDDVLLPGSAETESMQADIELLRLVAQLALVARAARA